MQKVLRKRIVRDFKANIARYIALGFLIMLSMYLIVSMLGAAETIIRGSEKSDQKANVEDGEFALFTPLTQEDKKELSDSGVSVEEMFSLDYTMDDTTVRVFKNRKNINKITANQGKTASKDNEVLLERRYCEDNDINVGDNVIIGGGAFLVVGTGTVPDYDSPLKSLADTGCDSRHFGIAFVTDSAYEKLSHDKNSSKAEEYYYSYKLDGAISHSQLKEQLKEKDNTLLAFVKAEDNARIQAASGDQELYRSAGTIAGGIILVLISYVLSVFVVHSIDSESSVIGALYALGVKKRDLMKHYIFLPAIIAVVSGILGTALGYSRLGVNVQMQDCYNYYSLPELDVIIMPYLIVYGVIAPPVICIIVTSLVINKRLSKPVLALIKNEQKAGRGGNIKTKKLKFISLFKVRQLLREKRTAFTVVFGMFVSMLIAVLALEIYVYCYNVKVQYPEDTAYEYMYTYKYPQENIPDGGYKAFAKTLKKSIYGYSFDVTVMGITDDNPFFDVNPEDSCNKVVISSSIMYKFGIGKGDYITLTDEENDVDYKYEVSDITQYSPGFVAFMPYEQALKFFDEDDGYYNVVFSDHKLDIPSEYLYSTTSADDVKKAAGIFVDQMKSMIYMLGAVSVIIFAIVLYLMMKIMIDRSAGSIALIKIFGYNNKEIKKMYLDGNFYVVAVGALISIPLAKIIMDAIYEPAFTPNIACGIDKSFPIWMYAAIFVAVLVLYFIINKLLVRRINKMTPAEVLKNRE